MSTTPLVSIVIPVYNRATVVGETLDSVVAQTYRPLQLILVDNDSSDDTQQVLTDWAAAHADDPQLQVEVTHEARHTAGAARNAGAAQAQGEWLMFFDSDDLMHPQLVERYMRCIDRHNGEIDLAMVRGTLELPDGSTQSLACRKRDILAVHLLHGQLATQRYIVRRSLFEAVDGWNIDLPGWNDWEMGVRLLLAGARVARVGRKSLVTVRHSGTDSITGTEFHTRHPQWERVLDIIETHLRCAQLPPSEMRRYLRLVEYRRIVLAAQYQREGAADLAQPLCREAFNALSRSYRDGYYKPQVAGTWRSGSMASRMAWRCCVGPVTRRLFARIAAGKRGSARIARHLY